jgi:hypothetical protein
MPSLELAKIFAIELVDCCVHVSFVAVKHFARLQLPSQVGSFVHAIIIAVQLAHL